VPISCFSFLYAFACLVCAIQYLPEAPTDRPYLPHHALPVNNHLQALDRCLPLDSSAGVFRVALLRGGVQTIKDECLLVNVGRLPGRPDESGLLATTAESAILACFVRRRLYNPTEVFFGRILVGRGEI
jgi:hypothetical protein